MSRVVCLGEVLIDFVATESGCTLADAPGFVKAAGGAPANVAAGVARLGVESAFLGKVGRDPFGEFLVNTLRKCGVDTNGIAYDSEARTTLAFVSLAKDGERDFVFYRNPGADQRYGMDDIPQATIEAADIFHFGSVSMTTEPARSATLHAAWIAKRAGKLVSFDPNLRRNLWPSDDAARMAIAEGAVFADILKVSEEEVAWLPAGLAPKLLLITRGEHGCEWRTCDASAHVAAFQVNSVDTTGAGDAFVAAMLAQVVIDPQLLTSPDRITQACRFANAAGAIATTKRGAIPSLPTRGEVEAVLG